MLYHVLASQLNSMCTDEGVIKEDINSPQYFSMVPPNSANGLYEEETECMCNITPSDISSISLELILLDIGDSVGCEFEYLEFGDGCKF